MYHSLDLFYEKISLSQWLLTSDSESWYDDAVYEALHQIWEGIKMQLHTCIASFFTVHDHLIYDDYSYSEADVEAQYVLYMKSSSYRAAVRYWHQ